MNRKIIYMLSLSLVFGLLFTSCNNESDKREAAKEYLRKQTNYPTSGHSSSPENDENSEVPADVILIITDKSFDKTINKGITLVDFWATWCRPCLIQAPIIEQIAVEMKDQIKVGKMDVDNNRATPQRFNVMNIPTLILFKDGVVVERIVGLTDKNTLLDYINKHI